MDGSALSICGTTSHNSVCPCKVVCESCDTVFPQSGNVQTQNRCFVLYVFPLFPVIFFTRTHLPRVVLLLRARHTYISAGMISIMLSVTYNNNMSKLSVAKTSSCSGAVDSCPIRLQLQLK